MKRGRGHLFLWLTLIALLGVGVISFFFPHHVFAPTHSSLPQNYSDHDFVSVSVGDVSFCAEGALSGAKQTVGLAKYSSNDFGKNDAMLFVFPAVQPLTFWMKNMRFDIDIVWVRQARIIGIERAVPYPRETIDDEALPRYSSPMPVDMVLEVLAHRSDVFHVGDKLNFGSKCEKVRSL